MSKDDKAFAANDLSLSDFMRVLRKRRLIAFLTLSIIVALATAYVFTTPPLYKATTRLLIEKESPNVLTIQDVMTVDASGTDYYQTQYKVIESRAVAREVVKRLGLESHPELAERPGLLDLLGLTGWTRELKARALAAAGLDAKGPQTPPPSPFEAAVRSFVQRVDVTPIRNSRLVDVSFLATDPVLAATVADAMAQAYIDNSLKGRIVASQEAVRWLRKSVFDERAKVEVAEREIQRFKEEHRIVTDFSTDSEQITAQKLGELNGQVVLAEAKRVAAQTRYEQAAQIQAGVLDALPEFLDSKYLIDLKNSENEAVRRLADLQRRFEPGYSKIVSAQADLKAIRDEKRREIGKIAKSLQNEYEIALAGETNLRDALTRYKQEAMLLGRNATEYSALKREAEGAHEMHELLQKRLRETSVAEDLKATNIHIVDAAEVPAFPSKPAKLPMLAAALLGGFVCAIGLAFLRERLDNTLAGPEDVETALRIPLLGAIPLFKLKSKGGMPEVVTRHSPRTVASEAFRGLRTNVLFSAADHPPQVLLVTSSAPHEGKTLNAANLAATMAQAGSKVLLLDCDLRRPRLHKTLEISREPGMSNMLAGSLDADQVIQATTMPNLDVVPTGIIPPNPAELLSSRRMTEFIAAMRERYDSIVIDSPPVTAVTDASVLARASDGVILVTRSGVTTKDFANRSLKQLRAMNAKILGAVLNGVDVQKDGLSQHYYYGEDERGGTRLKPDSGNVA